MSVQETSMSAGNSVTSVNSEQPIVNTVTSSTDLMHMVDPNQKSIEYKTEKNEIGKTGWKKYAGIIFTLLASLAFSFSLLFNKILVQKNYHPLNIAFCRYQGITICGALFATYMRIGQKQNIFKGIFDNKGRVLFLLLTRGTIGLCGVVSVNFSLQYLKLGDASVIFSSTPITVFLFARIFLGESCGIVPVFASLITLIGVGVLARPPLLSGKEEFDQGTLKGVSLGLVAILTLTGMFLITRYIRKVHFSLPVIFFGYTASIESFIIVMAMGIFELPRNAEDWCINIAGAIVQICVQVFLVLSLKFEAAGPVAIIRTLDIVFTFILQVIFFGVFPDALSLIGTSIILIGIVLTTFRKWLSTLPEDHSARKTYSFMLK